MAIPGMKQMVVVNVIEDKPEMPNVEIHAIGMDVVININSHKLFNTLSDMDLILVGLDKKLKELLQKHLDSNARKEVEILRIRKREADTVNDEKRFKTVEKKAGGAQLTPEEQEVIDQMRESGELSEFKSKPKGKSSKQDYFG
jgi:hypothetical protein